MRSPVLETAVFLEWGGLRPEWSGSSKESKVRVAEQRNKASGVGDKKWDHGKNNDRILRSCL